MKKTVCIIGGGVSGLASIKQCLEEGLQPICFEQDTDIGGIWNYSDAPRDGYPSLYNSCSINTSKEYTCFSDFPPPKEFPNFMSHKYFKQYLHLYADHFGLMKYINFEYFVESVRKTEDFDETGDWIVAAKNLKNGKIDKRRVNFVIVCNGHLHEPNIPRLPGLDKFKGKIVHTHDYKDFRGYEGKRIMVIGVGNSAADVSCELSRHAEHVYISTRTGSWVITRQGSEGRPFDHSAVSRLRQNLPRSLMMPLHFNALNDRFNHTLYGVCPNGKFSMNTVTISDDLPNRIILGRISMKTDVECFTENGVQFVDGTKIDNLDVVVLGTGYKFSFPFLEDGVVQKEDSFPFLYDLVWPCNLQPATLAIVGMAQVFGAVPPCLEMQARWACRVFSGKCKLPSARKRTEETEKRYSVIKSSGDVSSRRKCGFVIFYIQYLDKIAGHIGCKPRLWKYFFTDPSFWWLLYHGACTPSQWRLDGPGSWKGARNAIEHVEENTWFPMKTRLAGQGTKEGLYNGWTQLLKRIVLFVIVFLFLRFIFSNGYATYPTKA